MKDYSDYLLTVDYDRTLTAPDSTIPQRNIEAIRHFIANGGAFTVNTGRSIPMAARELIPGVPVNAPLLLYNGSADFDPASGTLTRFTPIELDCRAFCRELMERFPHLNVEIQGVEAHYLFRKNPGWETFCEQNGCRWAYCSLDALPQPMIKISIYGEFRKPTVADMYVGSPEELAMIDRAMEYVQEKYGHMLEIYRPCARIVDFHARGVSKLQAARLLQKRLEKKYLVCVGDAENDAAMLDGADIAYCPADAIVADRYENVCPCDEGTIADVIEKLP